MSGGSVGRPPSLLRELFPSSRRRNQIAGCPGLSSLPWPMFETPCPAWRESARRQEAMDCGGSVLGDVGGKKLTPVRRNRIMVRAMVLMESAAGLAGVPLPRAGPVQVFLRRDWLDLDATAARCGGR